MKIGIFGGTFNPVHSGHLINCEFLRVSAGLDMILFVPARSPVHKTDNGLADVEDRCEMISLAIADNPCFALSRIEIDRTEESYTVYTIDSLREIYPDDEISLIIGSDTFNELDTWKDYKKIISLVSLVVMTRPGDEVLRSDITEYSKNCIVTKNPMIEISSTVIRDMIKKGLSVRYQVHDRVNSYIIERGLYKN